MKKYRKLLVIPLAALVLFSFKGIEVSQGRALLSAPSERQKKISQAEVQIEDVNNGDCLRDEGLIIEEAKYGEKQETVTEVPERTIQAEDKTEVKPAETIEMLALPEPTVTANSTADPPKVEVASPHASNVQHEHVWVDEVVAYHEAVTHTEHHDAVTEQRWVSVPETTVHYICDVCGARFSTQGEIFAHEDATTETAIAEGNMSLAHSGHTLMKETTDNGYYETVIVSEAYDEEIVDQPAWEEHVMRCSMCGATG